MMLTMPLEKLTPDRRRQLTRDALVEAAADVFAKKGFNGASMEEIAAEAGFTRGAIYSNFGSKEELMLAVMDRFIDRQIDAFAAIDSDDPTRSALDAAEIFKRHLSLELLPLELELRLNAIRSPQARQRLVESDRRIAEKTAHLIDEQLVQRGMRLTVPALDLGQIGRAAIQGILLFAATDTEHAEHYDRLIESLFLLLAGAGFQ